ncbi:histone-lysine N-methyltransferase SMYD3 [Chlorella sorokiniana]|uniref:Histone-lysine N-methyltransferase SMYD3 n=1 Tax=Chlorella sorokiniana TaxID=3076 RepID=A0A2P6TML5_CHLSO|nr:histone-lysine N-methyltransferase SMYD3 [Chlorella sorokiniana]|eukprot:PRW45589.1 histone-lysine N-methyltransferase SMYD3 [Chlorella sorokiniana]
MAAGWSVEQLGAVKGRGVVARRAFKPGDLVLEDRAYAHAVVASELGSVCDCCLAPCSGPLRCSACKLVCYKTKEHQARAWRAGHREECAALRACAPRVPPTAVRLALRCALQHWRAQQAQQAQQRQQQQQQEAALAWYDALLQLQHHWEALSEGSKLQFAQMGALAHRLLEAAAPEAAEASSPRDLALLLARFGANSHTISDDELRPLAVGIFPLGALVNHGCQPNTVHSFAGDRMLFRAVRAIQPGEEVTTAYTELAAMRWERRRELLRHHQFDIDADAAGGSSAASAASSAAAEVGLAAAAAGVEGPSASGSAAAAAAGSSPAEGGAFAVALQYLPVQQPAIVLPLAGGADLHRAAVAAQQWEAALAAAYELLPLYRQAYPPVWPQLGLLWATVAKLEHLQERPSQAIQAAEQALHILTATHGGNGPAAETVRQRAAFHLSAAAEAGRRKEDSDSEDEANPNAFAAAAPADDAEQLWPPPIDQSQLRNPDGSIPQQPMSELVYDDTGRWDINTFISPALAAALEAAPPLPEDRTDPTLEQLQAALDKLERGEELGGELATEDDLRQLAEAIDLYMLAANPGPDPDVDDFTEADLQVLEVMRDTIREVLDGGARNQVINTAPAGRLPWQVLDVNDATPMVNWGVDLTEGKAVDPWKNALLSEEAKETMWRMHKEAYWTAEQLAEHFGIRVQRALAILALKEREHAARAEGVHLHTDLAEAMEIAQGALESMGARERHHVVLPSYPNYRELTEADADKLAAMLERRLGKPFDQIELEDMTPEVVQELRAAAGMDKEALEDELAAREEELLVEEFRRNLEYNLKKTGTTVHRSSRKRHPAARPAAGWNLLVKPLGKAAKAGERQPYVAAADGSQRELTEDEQLLLARQQPRAHHKIV